MHGKRLKDELWNENELLTGCRARRLSGSSVLLGAISGAESQEHKGSIAGVTDKAAINVQLSVDETYGDIK